MIPLKRLAIFMLNAGALLGCDAASPAEAADRATTGVAVVELFTSEGCSSCPPADAAVGDLIRDSNGKSVYVLAFHVDYWNGLGWADPFSQKAFTDRQTGYRQLFRLDNIYTPQSVVNGRTEFVGSDRVKLKTSVAAGLATPATGTVSVKILHDTKTASVAVTTSDLPVETMIHVAIVQVTATTTVPRGENGGRTLTHDNVVRAFASISLDNTGQASASLTAPAGGWPNDASVIVYAQRPADGQVLAAAEVAFPK